MSEAFIQVPAYSFSSALTSDSLSSGPTSLFFFLFSSSRSDLEFEAAIVSNPASLKYLNPGLSQLMRADLVCCSGI